MEIQKKSATVRAFVLEENKVLLVHERENNVLIEDPDGINPPRRYSGKRSKPQGWGLPGGNVDFNSSLEDLIGKLLKFILFFEIASDQKNASVILSSLFPERVESEEEFRLLLELIRESLLETGFLIKPIRQLFREEVGSSGHKVYVFHCEISAGKLQKRSVETDDCEWFELSKLPDGLFRSHLRRINKSCAILGIGSNNELMGGVL